MTASERLILDEINKLSEQVTEIDKKLAVDIAYSKSMRRDHNALKARVGVVEKAAAKRGTDWQRGLFVALISVALAALTMVAKATILGVG